MKKTILLLISIALVCMCASSQVIISGTPISQEFDGLGTGTTAALPGGWKFSGAGNGGPGSVTYGAVTNFTATNLQASSGSPATGGRYNWGNGANTNDRAIGFLTTGSYQTPNAIMCWFKNSAASTIQNLEVKYDIERYRINTSSFSLNFYYSPDGVNWSQQADGAISVSAFATGSNAYSFTAGTSVTRTVAINGLNLAGGSEFYLMWAFINSSSANSQGLGLDNVVITPTIATAALPVRFSNLSAQRTTNGVEVRWSNLSEAEVQKYSVEKSDNGINFSEAGQTRAEKNDGGQADYLFSITAPSIRTFYRISALEFSGSTVRSQTLAVQAGNPGCQLSLYPNPVTSDWINFQCEAAPSGEYIVAVYNISGKMVSWAKMRHGGGQLRKRIDTGRLPPGQYLLTVQGLPGPGIGFVRL